MTNLDSADPGRGYAMGLGRPTTPIPNEMSKDPEYWYTRLTIAWEHQDHDGRLILKLIGDINNLTEQLQKIRRLHKKTDGRCQECVQHCDCRDQIEAGDTTSAYLALDNCTHGNVPYPCPTIQQLNQEDTP